MMVFVITSAGLHFSYVDIEVTSTCSHIGCQLCDKSVICLPVQFTLLQ